MTSSRSSTTSETSKGCMQGYALSRSLRRAVGFCFGSTFVLIAAYFAFFLFVVSGVIGGLLEQEARLLERGAYVVGGFILVFASVMAIYAIGCVVHLWNKGFRREALKGLIMIVFLNVLTGYIWFYMSEVKGHRINYKLI